MKFSLSFICITILLIVSLQVAHAEGPPWRFTSANAQSSVRFGLLAQAQYESMPGPLGTGTSLNHMFLRRFRFLAGGQLSKKFSYFIESDAPNLGKKGLDGRRSAEIFLQDAYVSYAFRPEFHIDGGMILVPLSHNSTQSAATLLPLDYGPYSFLSSDPTHCKAGRDYGLQARGYIKNHFEYRFGVYRGSSDHYSGFPYRYTLRFAYYPLDADTGFFYTGTTGGQEKIISIGASLDRQNHYSANSVDIFVDLPLRKGDAFTVQADLIRYDGGSTFPLLSQQNAWLLESSYYIKKIRLGPFMQFASRDVTKPGMADERKMQGGIAFWLLQHTLNIKAGFARLFKTNEPARNQFVLQTQFFYY
jgi:hypothetical protein